MGLLSELSYSLSLGISCGMEYWMGTKKEIQSFD